MIYAVASGKGGTGKTTVAASLISLWDSPVVAVDLDVEEPNLHLFLRPEFSREEKAFIEVPEVDESKCTLCGACSEICQFKAVSIMVETLLTFPEMCHGCGGCLAVCPEKALSPGKRELGEICQGKAGEVKFVMGRLRVGEAMSPPLMKQVKDLFPDFRLMGDVVVDAPPGVSCPAVSAVIYSDCIVLVTEPTPFGFHDFKRFCEDKNIPIWAEIPYDRAIAEAYSRGAVVVEALEPLQETFHELRRNMRKAVESSREASHA